ncbi:septum formation initiator family protein [Curvibacter sp. APW13]|uniref:septum formation initiator family protein n=1 Tax=Curvibacter sp. APW13 TaxID=3077236 RepID=UPI0028DEE568|nr:septum formation initiator family protein [Curvibacter sp. APW13]MDT8991011.1 septum formation initiator family protein [Curvibacter sp. APW13]
MSQRLVPAVLIALLLVVHGQLWFGRGSLPSVSKLRQQLKEQQAQNQLASLANDRLAAEILDLQEGLEMIEEKARMELGMVKPNEIFVQLTK